MTSINSLEVRRSLVDALQIDLIGPIGALGDHAEILPQSPSRWYLTGFLVPTDADEGQRCDPTSNDELDQAAEPAGIDDDDTPEKPAARRSYLPSSMGVSVLVPAALHDVQAVVRYGEYLRVEPSEGASGPLHWKRIPREEVVSVAIGKESTGQGIVPVPNSRGVELVWSVPGDAGILLQLRKPDRAGVEPLPVQPDPFSGSPRGSAHLFDRRTHDEAAGQ